MKNQFSSSKLWLNPPCRSATTSERAIARHAMRCLTSTASFHFDPYCEDVRGINGGVITLRHTKCFMLSWQASHSQGWPAPRRASVNWTVLITRIPHPPLASLNPPCGSLSKACLLFRANQEREGDFKWLQENR